MNREDARRYVDRVLADAHHDRERGGTDSNEDVLKSKMIEALSDPGFAVRIERGMGRG
jgi:polyhydroxyalkanoate synthesis regulator phasin